MKQKTINQRANIVNGVLSYIYLNIETDLFIYELAEKFDISEHHLQRIFLEETGKNIYETIKSIRLQKAASLLLTNRHSTISKIASSCGYSSQASFVKAFRSFFDMTPSSWKKGEHKKYSDKILSATILLSSTKDFEQIPTIKKAPKIIAAYIRHRGYDISIKHTWNRLYAWSLIHEIDEKAHHIGFFHDNPTIINLKECAYIAAIALDKQIQTNSVISCFEIPSSVCAVFSFKGSFEEMLCFLQYIYQKWLPNSGYEAKTLPAYAIYHNNHFLNDKNQFDLEFYLPITI